MLGDVHDRQTLVDELESKRDTLPDAPALIPLVATVVAAELERRHRRYLAKRRRVEEIASGIQAVRLVSRWDTLPAAAASTLAIASGMYLAHQARRSSSIGMWTSPHS